MINTPKESESNWTFLTNHSHVLLCLADTSSMRIRDIAETVGITERAVLHIISDLDKNGYIERIREGRCNTYKINMRKKLRHPIEAHRKISGLISFIHKKTEDL